MAEIGPETSDSSVVGVFGKQVVSMRGRESFINVFGDDEGFTNGESKVKENGDLLEDGVGLEKEGAFMFDILDENSEGNALSAQGELRNHAPGACHSSQQLHIFFARCHGIV